MTRKLVVYGDIGMDIFVQVDRLPQAGQDAIASNLVMLPGGAAAHCAVVAARLGTPVRFVGLTGDDHLTDLLLADLRQHGVDTTHLRQIDGPTMTVIAAVDQSGERTMYSYRGIGGSTAYGPLPPDLLHPGDCLHLTGYSFQDQYSQVTALALIDAAHRQGALVALDPSFHFARTFATAGNELLQGVDFLFPNQEEAQLMSGVADPQQAARCLHQAGAKTVIVKRGRQGCTIASAQGIMDIPAYPVAPVVDTTGAGDAFCGGFLAAALAGDDVRDAARLGHAAAAHVIGQLGGHQAAPTPVQVKQLMKQLGW